MSVYVRPLSELLKATNSVEYNPARNAYEPEDDQLTGEEEAASSLQAEVIHYQAEPTAIEFHASPARVRGIMGPIGSGKSVACTAELLGQAISVYAFKGVRRSRYGVVRNTYPELKSTTIKTFMDWIPANCAKWNFGAPITCVLMIDNREKDGTIVQAEFVFLAMDKPKDVKKLKSIEFTGIWLNEASELPKAVLDMATGRIGRYPPKKQGGAHCRDFVVMDTNPPDDDHWWHNLAEEEKPEGYAFWQQPPAVLRLDNGEWIINPECENVGNQPKGARYWLDQIAGKTINWIQVFLQGKYGSVEDGKPVYPEWMPQVHLHDGPLPVNEGLPLILGWDFGRTPAVVICQLTIRGQFRVLDELVAVKMGIKQFANKVVKPYLNNNYNGLRTISYIDPAGANNQGEITDEITCLTELIDAGFVNTSPAPTNAFIPRRESVVDHMTTMIDGEPGFLVSSKCKYLRRGFNGRYKFRRMQVPGEELYSEAPIKNEVSHPHDALQYACLGSQGVDLVGESSTSIDRSAVSAAIASRGSRNWRTT